MNTRIVIDSNVLLSGLRSRNGFSFRLLKLIPENKFDICLSVPLVLEYEMVLNKFKKEIGLNQKEIGNFLDYLCFIGIETEIFYLWRPILKDSFDDHILEVAVGSMSKYIITFNKKDFQNIKNFGIKIATPKEFILERRLQ